MYSSLNRIAKEKPLLALVVISVNPNAVTPILTLTPALTFSDPNPNLLLPTNTVRQGRRQKIFFSGGGLTYMLPPPATPKGQLRTDFNIS